jgi:hypothetical protein
MKTKLLIFLILPLVIFSCSTPEYLPSHKEIEVNEYGAYVTLIFTDVKNLSGELIAVESEQVFILNEDDGKCMSIPLKNIIDMKIRYAKSPNYSWTIPVFMLISVSHGYFGIATLPINLITTIAVTTGAYQAYKFRVKKINPEVVRKFARFPQGIPPNVSLGAIK